MELIKVYQGARVAAQRDTEPSIEGIVVDKESSNDMDGDKVV